MPWIDVEEQWARPPRLKALRKPSSRWSGDLDVVDGYADLVDVVVQSADFGSADCSELSLTGCSLDGVTLGTEASIEVRRSTFNDCDLAQSQLKTIRSSRIAGCKLVGSDLSAATIADVVFEQCTLRYANLRMARLDRVLFVDCTLDEVDCFDLQADDVELRNTKLHKVNVDRLQAKRLDLRGASELMLTGVGDLTGCLVAEHQLPALAYSLAHATGLGVERPFDDDDSGVSAP